MKKSFIIVLCFYILVSSIPVRVESKEVIGWLEMVSIYPGNLKIRAKMDTGAKSSSINVYNLQKFKHGEEAWVKFDLIVNTKKKGRKKNTFEKKVLHLIKIKRKGGGLEERLVVNMEICLGSVHREIEMSLIDRSNFNYQVLIGRTDLENIFIVDPSVQFTHKPACKISVNLDY